MAVLLFFLCSVSLLPCCPEKDGVGRCSATTPNTLESGYVLVCRCDGS